MILSIQTLYDIQPLLTIRSEGNSQSNCKRTLSDNSRCVMWIYHAFLFFVLITGKHTKFFQK